MVLRMILTSKGIGQIRHWWRKAFLGLSTFLFEILGDVN